MRERVSLEEEASMTIDPPEYQPEEDWEDNEWIDAYYWEYERDEKEDSQ